MSASVEDFVKRLVRGNRKFTFVFTEDFFTIVGKAGVDTGRFRDIRNAIRHVEHKKGLNAEIQKKEDTILFDVEVGVVKKGFNSFMTTFDELTKGPFADTAVIYGMGEDMIDAQKAKFQVDSFMSEKNNQQLPTKQLIENCRKRKIVLIVEKPADFKRPSLEPFLKLRAQLTKILISQEKGATVVDCQVGRIYEPGNSSSLSTLLNMFCVHY